MLAALKKKLISEKQYSSVDIIKAHKICRAVSVRNATVCYRLINNRYDTYKFTDLCVIYIRFPVLTFLFAFDE